jgi:hypothetical protein
MMEAVCAFETSISTYTRQHGAITQSIVSPGLRSCAGQNSGVTLLTLMSFPLRALNSLHGAPTLHYTALHNHLLAP